MKLTTERYMMLYDRFLGTNPLETPVEVTLASLAEALFCTPRNAKLILRNLTHEALIEWQPGRGRGNRSRLLFKIDKESYLFKISRQIAEQGDYQRAFEWLNRYGEGTIVKPKFIEWLNAHFGYKKEEGKDANASDSLRFPVFRPILTLDPGEVVYSFDAHIVRQIFDRLVRYDPVSASIVPGIAHTWQSNASATEWTFYLRKGVLFHDGRELTAADVAYTFERLCQDTSNRWVLRGFNRIEPAGRRVVKFMLDKPNRLFDRFMCTAAASILPNNLNGRTPASFWQLPIGTGPFQVLSHTKNLFKLAANNTYYQGRAYLDNVDIVILPVEYQTNARTSSEILHLSDYHQQERPLEADWQQIQQICHGCTMMTWNRQKVGPQQSVGFRQAVHRLLPLTKLIADLGGDRAIPAYGFRPYTSLEIAGDPSLLPRYAEAAELGSLSGTMLRIAAHDYYRSDAEWIAERLRQYGLQVELQIYNWRNVHEPDSTLTADCIIHGIILAEDEVCEIEAYEHTNCALKLNLDPAQQAWIETQIDQALAASPEERQLALRLIETQLREDASVLFLHHRNMNASHHSSVRGAGLNTSGWIDFKEIWLEHEE